MSAVPVKLMEWTRKHSIHVPEVDKEHRHFFDLLNRLHAAMLAGKGATVLRPLLVETVQYTHDHFAHEEVLMAEARYPGLRGHREQHTKLKQTAMEFMERYERGEATMTIEFTLFLSDWIKQHLMETDRLLGEYLIATGRASQPGGRR